MQNAKGQGVDVINEVLEDCLMAYPVSRLLISLYQQYQKRGFLTKKQLQGLHAKGMAAPSVSRTRLATLEAIIRKMPNRVKSELPANSPMYEKDDEAGQMIDAILAKYPEHKRVLFFKSRFNNNETLSALEITELKKFYKVATK